MLISSAQRKDERIQAPCAVFQIVRRHLGNGGQLLPFAPRVQNGKIVFLLIGRDAGRRLHPLGKQPQQLVVDFVNACSVLG